MSILISYLDGDATKRLHINDYDKKLHKGRIKCPEGHDVVGKKGEKVVWHYAHTKGVACESSREMGPWHRWWQDRVEPDCLEIRMKRDGKLHIADMVNGDDCIVEFQKSVVKPEIIREREAFYGNMIWIFCCVDFVTKIVSQKGRFMKLKITQGSRYFLEARKKTFLDFDRRGVLELIEVGSTRKTNTTLYVRIWTMGEFDDVYMRGCLKEKATSRIDRQPYIFDDNTKNFDEVKKSLNSK
jgi:competence CoiA-like predicted nuclease